MQVRTHFANNRNPWTEMTPPKSGDIVRQLIAQHAATPDGFRPIMAKPRQRNAAIIARKMAKDGLLRQVIVGATETRYFLDKKHTAAAWLAAATAKQPESTTHLKPSRGGPSVKNAVAVYPPGYKFSSRPLAQPRNQVVALPGVHGGMGQM